MLTSLDSIGNYIYKNNKLTQIVGDMSANVIDAQAWEKSLFIMKEKKQQIIEEEAPNGKSYLTVKAPLLIGDEVEGVMGVSIDITEKKKREGLESKLKMREELYEVAREVAHDICSPLSALETVRYMSLDKLGDQERKIFELSTRRIKGVTKKLIERYRGKEGVRSKEEKEEEWIMPSSVKDIIESMRYRYQNREINFKFNEEERVKFAFIRGEYSTFSRMITNVIKNGVEATEGKKGEIEVREIVKGEEVEIRVKDNGQGMPKEMAEKIMRGEEEVGTTKEDGHGIGMGQIMGTIKAMRGKIKIDTKEGEGTEFILTFQKAGRPRWFEDKIEIKKGEEVVILDDELVMHEVWKEKLKGYEKEIIVKYFTKGLEALKYLKEKEDKGNVFLIADYELRKQEINGIVVIDKGGMKGRHIMVTNAYLSDIKDFEEKSGYLKIFPKMYINDIRLRLV